MICAVTLVGQCSYDFFISLFTDIIVLVSQKAKDATYVLSKEALKVLCWFKAVYIQPYGLKYRWFIYIFDTWVGK